MLRWNIEGATEVSIEEGTGYGELHLLGTFSGTGCTPRAAQGGLYVRNLLQRKHNCVVRFDLDPGPPQALVAGGLSIALTEAEYFPVSPR